MRMKEQLEKLLNIYGTSGNEGYIRAYLEPILLELMDEVEIDSYGNLLGTKKCGDGIGATVLLSAHMDTVKEVQSYKKVIEKDGIFTAELPNGSRGVLGADDRAGIAIILAILNDVSGMFDGVLKIAFTVEEETGLDGADHISKSFTKGIDLAIVVDRRGNRDIVVGCDIMPFCSNVVGHFMQISSQTLGLYYKCVEGGVSDSIVFAERGINTVNLSAGYHNEHTKDEYVSIAEMLDTVRLIRFSLVVINEFYHKFGSVPKENLWVKNNFENQV